MFNTNDFKQSLSGGRQGATSLTSNRTVNKLEGNEKKGAYVLAQLGRACPQRFPARVHVGSPSHETQHGGSGGQSHQTHPPRPGPCQGAFLAIPVPGLQFGLLSSSTFTQAPGTLPASLGPLKV